MFPDKTEGDLLADLTENNFDLSETIHEVLSKRVSIFLWQD